jgi:hypothetical protein
MLKNILSNKIFFFTLCFLLFGAISVFAGSLIVNESGIRIEADNYFSSQGNEGITANISVQGSDGSDYILYFENGLIVNYSFEEYITCHDLIVKGGEENINDFELWVKIDKETSSFIDTSSWNNLIFMNDSCSNGGAEMTYNTIYENESEATFRIMTNLLEGDNHFSVVIENSVTSNENTTFLKNIYSGENSFYLDFSVNSSSNISDQLGLNSWIMTGGLNLMEDNYFGSYYSQEYFDKLNNYISHPTLISNNIYNTATYSFWWKGKNSSSLAGRGTTSLDTYYLLSVNSSGTLSGLYINNGCYSPILDGNNTGMNDDKWHLVTLSWDTVSTYFYVDGILIKTCSYPGPAEGGTGGDFLFRSYHTFSGIQKQDIANPTYSNTKRSQAWLNRYYQNINNSYISIN